MNGRALLWFGLALVAGIVTLVTYLNADPGETYVIWWGAIGVGLWNGFANLRRQ
jgi:hypothetical protein